MSFFPKEFGSHISSVLTYLPEDSSFWVLWFNQSTCTLSSPVPLRPRCPSVSVPPSIAPVLGESTWSPALQEECFQISVYTDSMPSKTWRQSFAKHRKTQISPWKPNCRRSLHNYLPAPLPITFQVHLHDLVAHFGLEKPVTLTSLVIFHPTLMLLLDKYQASLNTLQQSIPLLLHHLHLLTWRLLMHHQNRLAQTSLKSRRWFPALVYLSQMFRSSLIKFKTTLLTLANLPWWPTHSISTIFFFVEVQWF